MCNHGAWCAAAMESQRCVSYMMLHCSADEMFPKALSHGMSLLWPSRATLEVQGRCISGTARTPNFAACLGHAGMI